MTSESHLTFYFYCRGKVAHNARGNARACSRKTCNACWVETRGWAEGTKPQGCGKQCVRLGFDRYNVWQKTLKGWKEQITTIQWNGVSGL